MDYEVKTKYIVTKFEDEIKEIIKNWNLMQIDIETKDNDCKIIQICDMRLSSLSLINNNEMK